MMDDNKLEKKIHDKRQSIELWVKNWEPKVKRLTNLNIISSALMTILTVAPVIGGKTFIEFVLGNSNHDSLKWKLFFVIVALLSLVSLIVAQLLKSNNIMDRLSKARACDAKLEGLETLLDLKVKDRDKVASEYMNILPEIAFISGKQKTHSTLENVIATIINPQNDEIVGDLIFCSGTAEGLGSNLYLWLIVEKDDKFWPKERAIRIDDGNWKFQIHEPMKDSFTLSLYAANKKANDCLRDWLDKANQNGKYPGMSGRPDGLIRVFAIKCKKNN
jgi:hypothetical protein